MSFPVFDRTVIVYPDERVTVGAGARKRVFVILEQKLSLAAAERTL